MSLPEPIVAKNLGVFTKEELNVDYVVVVQVLKDRKNRSAFGRSFSWENSLVDVYI
jgi:hypothetical protein